jgi:GntR family transcriptional regulator
MTPAPGLAPPDERLPRYRRLADALAARVRAGEWPPGTALPAESRLASDAGVALGTLRAALADLEREGLVERRHGRGTFVRAGLAGASMLRFFRFRSRAGAAGAPQAPASRILALREVKLDEALAARLAAGRSRRGLFLLRLRSLEERPVLLERIWLPLARFRALAPVPPRDFPDLLYPFYAERCGIVVARASEDIGFRRLAAEDAARLRLPAGHPAAAIERTAYDLTGQPCEYRVTLGDADHFQYAVELR